MYLSSKKVKEWLSLENLIRRVTVTSVRELVSYLKYLLLMFHYMDVDDVVQDIISSIKKAMDDDDGELTLRDAFHIAVEKHDNVIL